MHTTPRVRAVLDTPSLPLCPLPTCTPSSIVSIVIANFVVLSGRWCTQDVPWFLGDVGADGGGGGGGGSLSLVPTLPPTVHHDSCGIVAGTLAGVACTHTPVRPLPAHRSHTYTPWYPFGRLAATRNTSLRMCAWSWEGAWGCSAGRMGCTQRLHVAGGGCVHRDRQAEYAPAALLQLRKAMTKECEGAQGIGKRSNPGGPGGGTWGGGGGCEATG